MGNFLTIFYGDLFYLTNKTNKYNLYVDTRSKSPATQNCEGIINIKLIFSCIKRLFNIKYLILQYPF